MVRNPRVGETVFIGGGAGMGRRIGYVTKVHGETGDINCGVYDEDGTYQGGYTNVGPLGKRPGDHYWYWIDDKKAGITAGHTDKDGKPYNAMPDAI